MSTWLEILTLLAEGGSISVMGKKVPETGWTYAVILDEETLSQLVDDVLPEETYSQIVTDSWESLLEMIDRYPWIKLYPKLIHDEFKKKILAAVLSRTSDPWIIQKWNEA